VQIHTQNMCVYLCWIGLYTWASVFGWCLIQYSRPIQFLIFIHATRIKLYTSTRTCNGIAYIWRHSFTSYRPILTDRFTLSVWFTGLIISVIECHRFRLLLAAAVTSRVSERLVRRQDTWHLYRLHIPWYCCYYYYGTRHGWSILVYVCGPTPDKWRKVYGFNGAEPNTLNRKTFLSVQVL
jgi:hypothetical protein